MKFTKINIGFIVFFICGLVVFALHTLREEAAKDTKDLISMGNQLVSLIPLYPIDQLKDPQGHFLLRTLVEYDSGKRIVYLFIHDKNGALISSLTPDHLLSLIPESVKVVSVSTVRLIHQTYKLGGSGEKIYEFAKPIFKGPERAGAVRLGLRLRKQQYVSTERLSLLALVAFFIISAMVLSYYGVTLALKPLRNMSQNIQNVYGDNAPDLEISSNTTPIAPMVENLEASLAQICERLSLIDKDNISLASKLGVATFEKNQIMKILDSTNFGIVITDSQDNISHINEYMLKLIQKKSTDALDRPLDEVLGHEEIASFLERDDTLEQTGSAVHIDTTFPEFAPGEIYRVTALYLLDDENSPIGRMISLNNISAEKMAEDAQQNFIAHVAHELMTPLTNIRSYSEMLMDGEVDDLDMQKEFYNTINDQTTRLTGLIKNLLDLSKMEMGSLTITKGRVKTDWFVEDCLSSIEASAQDKNITVEKNLPDLFPTLMADKNLLKAAIINMLGNALKYTPENGKISFAISEENKTVIFDVIDTGYGISEEELPKVFEKFFRSENPQVSEQGGAGLGLAITNEIVRLHGGEIEVKSELGKGSHFAIKIPKEEYYLGKE
ncbi:MAG: PAS domain-containing sensor histidine kinase [Desulfobacterales bacterium]